MGLRLYAKEELFYDLFEQAACILEQASFLLVEAIEHADTLSEKAKRMERLEHDGDIVLHEVMDRLNRTFITPIDREDIHKLSSALDDMLDLIEESTERFILYKVTSTTPQALALAKVIQGQAQQIRKVTPKLRNLRHARVVEHCKEINRLENVGDRTFRDAIAALFEGNPDPLDVIKWRELYGLLESASDKGEDVAVAIEGIALKNA